MLARAGRQLHLDAVVRLRLLRAADAQLAVDGGAVVRDLDIDRGPGAGPDVAAQEGVRVDRTSGLGWTDGEPKGDGRGALRQHRRSDRARACGSASTAVSKDRTARRARARSVPICPQSSVDCECREARPSTAAQMR